MIFRSGYDVIQSCISQEKCRKISAQIRSVQGVGTRCLLNQTWCKSLASDLRNRLAPNLPEITSLKAIQCTYFNKSAKNNWFVAFHQDRSIPVMPSAAAQQQSGWSQKEGMTFVHGPDVLMKQLIAVRLHLDDSTLENGPLRVIPSSHQYGTLTPERVKEIRDSCQEKTLLVERGGAIAMRPLILHASSKSQVEQPRRVLHFLFGPTTLPNGLEWRLTV